MSSQKRIEQEQQETYATLLESAELLHSSLDEDELLRHLLRSVMGRLRVTRGLIAIADEKTMRLSLVRGATGLRDGDEYREDEAFREGIETIIPIGRTEGGELPVGLLGLHLAAGRELTEGERDFLQGLLGIAASGIINARSHTKVQQLNQALDQRVQELRALLDLVRGLTATLEPDEVAQLLVLTLAGRWALRRYGLIAWKYGHPVVLRARGMDLGGLVDYQSYENLLPELPVAVRIGDLPESELKERLRTEQAEVIFRIEAGDETTGGLVILGPRPGSHSFSEADLDFGTGLVAQAAVAFENSWYFKEALERRKVEQELALAATIQETLFPARLPELSGYDLAARNRPARHCGGDYYDILPLGRPDGSEGYLICVADVAGKGLPASLLMSNMQATLRALLGGMDSLPALASRINGLLYATTPSNKYVTAILIDLDPLTGRVRYVNAGHTDCLHLRADGEAIWLKGTGTPLGLIPDLPYAEESLQLDPGDVLALFSDGVTEAQSPDEVEFGEGRVVNLFRQIASQSAHQMVGKVFDEIDRYAGEAPQYDDITLFVVRRDKLWPNQGC